MNQLKIFENPEFGQVRTIEEEGKIYFCGSDIAKSLGYIEPHKAISRHCKGGMKRTIPTTSGKQEMMVITEGDIYRLVVKSQMPYAERFESWIFDDIVPSVRKHGMYATEELLNNPDLFIKALQDLKAEREEKKALQVENARMKPKEIFADAVAASNQSILIGNLAKLLSQNGVEIGQNRFFNWLRNHGYLIKGGSRRNMPTQKSMELGLFEVTERAIDNPDGSVRLTRTTKVTGKGQQYFINKFLKEKLNEK